VSEARGKPDDFIDLEGGNVLDKVPVHRERLTHAAARCKSIFGSAGIVAVVVEC